jgi:cytochrome o ubiquinol oxidase subunit 3
MSKSHPEHERYPDAYHDIYSRTTFGIWMYLLSDFILFGTLFATYVVLRNNVFGGPTARDLFDLRSALIQTLILITASFTVGIAGASAHRRNKHLTISLFTLTFLLGIAFMWMELAEFSRLVGEGNSWKISAFLSAYFTVVGTFGIHMIFALLWVPILIIPVWKEGLTPVSIRRLTCLKIFWQFLSIIWIFIFSFIYLLGVKYD